MSQQTEKRSYKKTLNLPRTGFAMKANLVQNEPATQKRWAQADLYRQVRRAPHPKGPFIFHDGPPYANGPIHLGHLLNKVLKDFIVRTKTMVGYDCPYVPGWDCHGLPIEHKVMQDLGPAAKDLEPIEVRRKCKASAHKFVKLQKAQMQRLLTLADYDAPYLTMDPAYEAAVLEVFADLVGKGLVYRGLKPVHWSIENRTALAEAELEYYDRKDTSVYVAFEVTLPSNALGRAAGRSSSSEPPVFMIWTTTPWTLPANLAVAVHPRYEYGLYLLPEGLIIIAAELAPTVLGTVGLEAKEPIATLTGAELAGAQYKHPFIDDGKTRPVVTADYITLEDGTGLVHTAPGHGLEDYQIALRESIDVYCPVRDDGTFDHTMPDWLRGKSVWEANNLIIERLRASGHLFHDHRFTHSYPHDWRGKTPVILRATEQWFINVDHPYGNVDPLPSESGQRPEGQATATHGPAAPNDQRNCRPEALGDGSLRQRAMQMTADQIRFIPEWGRNRMHGMLDSRPDWCLSRQRAWGLPIPAFYNDEGQFLLTEASVRAVADSIAKHGADTWFAASAADLLETYEPTSDPDAPPWLTEAAKHQDRSRPVITGLTKSTDIFDVWFESGSSWHAAVRQRGLARPQGPLTDLYLEGSDQHRGWFQLSLLPSLGVTGQSPFKTVLTHGFMVDKNGRKMSKSLGNTLDVDDLLKKFGADVCRWWVSSLNTDNDIKVDRQFFALAGEEYRKVRNTIRFLLSNLGDFDPGHDRCTDTDTDATSPNAWALGELTTLVRVVVDAYDCYQFRRAHEALFNFCNDTMSAVYLAAMKDRLYCDSPVSRRRRHAQTTIHTIADGLIRLLAPLMPHTADEAWRALHGADAPNVHLESLPSPPQVVADPDWPQVLEARDAWLKTIEAARQELGIDNPLDCGLTIPKTDWLARFDPVDLADLCGISRCQLALVDAPKVQDLRDQPRCERSWKRDGTVKQRSDGGMLGDRDAEALGLV